MTAAARVHVCFLLHSYRLKLLSSSVVPLRYTHVHLGFVQPAGTHRPHQLSAATSIGGMVRCALLSAAHLLQLIYTVNSLLYILTVNAIRTRVPQVQLQTRPPVLRVHLVKTTRGRILSRTRWELIWFETLSSRPRHGLTLPMRRRGLHTHAWLLPRVGWSGSTIEPSSADTTGIILTEPIKIDYYN